MRLQIMQMFDALEWTARKVQRGQHLIIQVPVWRQENSLNSKDTEATFTLQDVRNAQVNSMHSESAPYFVIV